MKMKRLAVLAALAVFAAPALATPVEVEITGAVEFNQINFGVFADVNPGDDAVMTFLLDSDDFFNSPNFPTRGYVIDHASYSFMLGSVTVGLQDPFPAGQTPYFVLRDNDPAVDGFFLSTNVDFPFGVPLSEEGQIEQFTGNFSVAYDNDPLPSLDILDAAGVYQFDGLTSFNFTIGDGPFDAMGLIFEQLTITVVPAPASLLLLAPFALARRRRR
jgi:hypothetical protein